MAATKNELGVRYIMRFNKERALTCLATFGLLALFPTVASGQSVCVGEPSPLPGLSGPPTWDASDPSASYARVDLHDPRWARGKPVDLGLGGTSTYRILYDDANDQLIVSIQAHDDKDGAGNPTPALNDHIYFGIGVNSSPTSGHLVRIRFPSPAAGTANEPTTVGSSDYATWQNSDGNSGSWVEDFGSSQPAWMLYPVVWKNNTTANGNSDWGVNFKVDLTHPDIGLVDATSVQLRITLGSRVYDEDLDNAVDLALPTGASPITNTFIQEDMTTWLFTDPLADPCTGIALDRMQMGVGSALGNTIDTDSGDVNEFVAKPTGIGFSGQISARFRIANWGSIADPAAGWNPIGDDSVPQELDIVNTGSGATGEIRLTCPANTATETCGITTPATIHQCMLVEMQATPGNSADFVNASVYRNMNFGSLSTLQREASISVAGLKERTGLAEDRDVYLTELRLNMPVAGTTALVLPRADMAAVKDAVQNPRANPNQVPCKRPQDACIDNVCSMPCNQGKCDQSLDPRDLPGGCFCFPLTGGEKCDVPTPDAVPGSLTGEQQLESVWPTWKIFAYWDTGERETIEGVEVKKLQPMYPFGLYLDHDGTHYGFSDALAGLDGVVVNQLNSFQYRLSVESEGTATLGVTVTAEEEPVDPGGAGGGGGGIPPVDPWDCVCSTPTPGSFSSTGSGFAALGLLAFAWTARRRRRPQC